MNIQFVIKSLIVRDEYLLVVEAENVKIEDDVTQLHYDGKPGLFNSTSEVSEEGLKKIGNVLGSMLDYRVNDWDSSTLIYALLDKLPQEKLYEVIKTYELSL